MLRRRSVGATVLTYCCACLVASSNLSLADTASIVAEAKPAVVFIHHRNALNEHGYGTGFLVSPRGYVITCAHVVAPITDAKALKKATTSDKIWVRRTDGTTHEAVRVYCDGETDSALLSVPGSNLPYLVLAQSRPAQGKEVLVMGYPLGDLLGKELAVTCGIVSTFRLDGTVLQLDAATNPGCSGGPVLDEVGKVVGIAWARLPGLEGVNFAISTSAIPTPVEMIARSPYVADDLLNAIDDGNLWWLQALLTANPTLVNKHRLYAENLTPLQVASSEGKTDVARLLIEMGADVDLSGADDEVPLALAAYYGHLALVKLLLDSGASVKGRDRRGDFSPLHKAVMYTHRDGLLLVGLAREDKLRVDDVLKAGRWPERFKGFDRARQLSVARLLLSRGASLSSRATMGWTPLHLAAEHGAQLDILKLLVSNGAPLDTKDDWGLTPLHHAALFGNWLAANVLVREGADADARAPDHGTPLHAAADRNAKAVAEVLISRGADLEARDKNGFTPLNWAAWSRSQETAELLIAKEADVNTRNNDGETPLCWAALWGKKRLAELLLAAGADVNANGAGTALHTAAYDDLSYDVARSLILHGANVSARDEYGWTPLHVAAEHGNPRIADLLIGNGADVSARTAKARKASAVGRLLGRRTVPAGSTPLQVARLCRHKSIAEIIRKHRGTE